MDMPGSHVQALPVLLAHDEWTLWLVAATRALLPASVVRCNSMGALPAAVHEDKASCVGIRDLRVLGATFRVDAAARRDDKGKDAIRGKLHVCLGARSFALKTTFATTSALAVQSEVSLF